MPCGYTIKQILKSICFFLCPWMGGISQRAMDGGVNMPKDGRTDICSCNICTSAIRGGRILQRAREGGANMPRNDNVNIAKQMKV